MPTVSTGRLQGRLPSRGQAAPTGPGSITTRPPETAFPCGLSQGGGAKSPQKENYLEAFSQAQKRKVTQTKCWGEKQSVRALLHTRPRSANSVRTSRTWPQTPCKQQDGTRHVMAGEKAHLRKAFRGSEALPRTHKGLISKEHQVPAPSIPITDRSFKMNLRSLRIPREAGGTGGAHGFCNVFICAVESTATVSILHSSPRTQFPREG